MIVSSGVHAYIYFHPTYIGGESSKELSKQLKNSMSNLCNIILRIKEIGKSRTTYETEAHYNVSLTV